MRRNSILNTKLEATWRCCDEGKDTGAAKGKIKSFDTKRKLHTWSEMKNNVQYQEK